MYVEYTAYTCYYHIPLFIIISSLPTPQIFLYYANAGSAEFVSLVEDRESISKDGEAARAGGDPF